MPRRLFEITLQLPYRVVLLPIVGKTRYPKTGKSDSALLPSAP